MQDSIDRQPSASPAKLDVRLIHTKDHVHTRLDALHAETLRIVHVPLDANQPSHTPLTNWPRNSVDSVFPNVALLSTSSTLSLHDVEMWLFDMFTQRMRAATVNYSFAFAHTQLYALFEAYVPLATKAYANNPLGYSRMILVHMTVVCTLDCIALLQTPLLRNYHLGIDHDLVESLVLPDHALTTYAYSLHRFIRERNSGLRFSTSIVDHVVDKWCFGAQFAAVSPVCLELKRQLLATAHQRHAQRMAEVDEARRTYNRMLQQSTAMWCSCRNSLGLLHFACDKCSLVNKAEGMSENVYEWPLPDVAHECDAVMFELLMPAHLASLRDSLYLTRSELLSLAPAAANSFNTTQVVGTWLDYEEVSAHALRHQKYTTLVSTTKLFANTHYKCKHPKEPTNDFVPRNGYNVKTGTIKVSRLFQDHCFFVSLYNSIDVFFCCLLYN